MASRILNFLEILFLVSSKSVVVSLAICGAFLAFVAPKVRQRSKSMIEGNISNIKERTSKLCSTIGYLLTALSIFLFIIAGFISDLK